MKLAADSPLLGTPAQRGSCPKKSCTPVSRHSEDYNTASSSDEMSSPQRVIAAKTTGFPSAPTAKRDLSSRAPPTDVAFGRKANHKQSSEGKSEFRNTAPTSKDSTSVPVRPIDVSQMHDAQELRRQMIASGEIQGRL